LVTRILYSDPDPAKTETLGSVVVFWNDLDESGSGSKNPGFLCRACIWILILRARGPKTRREKSEIFTVEKSPVFYKRKKRGRKIFSEISIKVSKL
jgi:hypothetical protein